MTTITTLHPGARYGWDDGTPPVHAVLALSSDDERTWQLWRGRHKVVTGNRAQVLRWLTNTGAERIGPV